MKNILFHCWPNENWMGGVYYIRNMAFALLQNKEAMQNLHIYILTGSKTAGVFQDLADDYGVIVLLSDKLTGMQRLIKRCKKIWYVNIRKKDVHRDLLPVVDKYHIDYIYPMCYRDDVYADKGIMWIPDLQHIYFPEYFPGKQLEQREKEYEYLARSHKKLVLSSESARADYCKAYPRFTKNLFVIPFVSAIEPYIIKNREEERIRRKYGLPERYFLVANQFWRHKNHKIVFEALHYAKDNGNAEMLVVCTGKPDDNRDASYAEEIRRYIRENHLERNLNILGFIDREDQLYLMKGCMAVIQPSLFEGWGTVVEDAKTLHKSVIMSDIAVHMEQKNEDCVIFERNNSRQLAEIMCSFWKKPDTEKSRSGYDFVEQAAVYGKLFYEMLGGGGTYKGW